MRIGQVDDRAGRRVEVVPVDREPCEAGDDDVDLLVPGAFVVLFDHEVADLLGRVRVHAERADAEPPADRPPLEPFLDRNPVELVDSEHAVGA